MTKRNFKVYDKRGIFLCIQAAVDEAQAVDFAYIYGHRKAFSAVAA